LKPFIKNKKWHQLRQEQYIMNVGAEAEPILDNNQDDQDNAMPGWLWGLSMILMPAATGLIGGLTGMLENGWLPETFRLMLSNAQGTEEAEGPQEAEDKNKEKDE